MKKCCESNNALSNSSQKMTSELTMSARQIADAGDLVDFAESLKNVTLQIDESDRQMQNTVKKAFIEPMRKFHQTFSNAHGAIKRREQSLQDYSKYMTRREKFQKDPSFQRSGKYDANEKYLFSARVDFERRNRQLMDDLPKFYAGRITYFEPCFEALIKAQMNHYDNAKTLFEVLDDKFNCSWDIPLQEEEFQQEVNKMLDDIKSISIVTGK